LFGTIKTLALFTTSSILIFVLMALAIHRFSVMEQDISGALKMAQTGLLFPVYAILGAICGLAYGAAASAKRKADLLEEGIHKIAGPLMEAAIGITPADGREIGVGALKRSLDMLASGALKNRRGWFGPFSIPGALAGLFLGSMLRIIRRAAIGEFLDAMEKSGRNTVSVKDVEAFARKRLVASAVSVFKGRLNLIQYACYLAGLIFSIPAILALLM